MKKVLPSSNGISLHFQVASLFLTLVMIISLVLLQVRKFLRRRYCSTHLTGNAKKLTAWCRCNTHQSNRWVNNYRHFPSFDVARNDFEFSGIIWFSFDPALVNLENN